jgi:hypothetical protein
MGAIFLGGFRVSTTVEWKVRFRFVTRWSSTRTNFLTPTLLVVLLPQIGLKGEDPLTLTPFFVLPDVSSRWREVEW